MRIQHLPRLLTLALIALLAAAVQPASAHEGSRIFLARDDGRIKTYLGNDNEESTAFEALRVFKTTLPLFPGTTNVFTTEFPGYQVNEVVGGITAGTEFTFSISGPLRYFVYDSPGRTGTYKAVEEVFLPPDPVPQIYISQGQDREAMTGPSPDKGFEFFTYNSAGDHAHSFYTYFGNGADASNGPNGVYAVPLKIFTATDQSDISLEFFLLLGKGVALTSNEMIDAERVANATLVPEPAFAAAAGLLACGCLGGRRRRGMQENTVEA